MTDENEKADSIIKCPNCDEDMFWDDIVKAWVCLSCSYVIRD